MPRGKLRSPEEINGRIRELKKKHRPLLQELERLDIQARALDWALGGEDTFEVSSNGTAEVNVNSDSEAVAEG